MGCGIIVRDYKGFVIAAQSKRLNALQELVIAEAMAALVVVEFSRDLGIHSIILEGDSLLVVQAIRDQGNNLRPYGQIVDDVRLILQMLLSWMVSRVKREANTAAHCLPKFALNCTNERIWMEESPECIFNTVTLEQSALFL